MKLFLKRLTLFVAVFGLAIAFVGCGGDDTTTVAQTTEGTTEAPTTEAPTTADLFDTVPNMIIIDGSDQITGNFLLPGEVQGVTITYASDNTDVAVISDSVNEDGFYTVTINTPSIPEGGVNTSVVITGTMTKDTETETFTKTIRVLAQNVSFVDNIADLYATLSLNDVTEITGIVYATFDGGFFIYDETGTLGIYDSSVEVEIGDEVTLKGTLANYYTLYQLSDIANYTINSSDNTVDVPVTVLGNGAYIAEADSSNKALHGQVFTVTGKLVELTSGNYTNMFLLDVDGNKIAQIYHYGNESGLDALHDNYLDTIITLDVVYYTDHGDVVYVVFDGVAADVTTHTTNEEIAAFYANALEIDSEFVKNTAVDLPTTITKGTVTWAVGTGETNVTFDGAEASFADVTTDTDAELVATVVVKLDDNTEVTVTKNFTVTILNLTKADLVAEDKAALTFKSLDVEELDALDLPTEGARGSEITWEVKSGAAVIDDDEVLFDYTGAAGSVVLKATITNGTESDTKEFTFNVSAATISTIADVLAAADGDFAIKGNVYYLTKNGFFIEDETGQIFVYNTPTMDLGDEVVVKGGYAEYKDSPQLSYVEVSAVLSSDNDVTQTATVYDPATTTLVPGSTYTVTGTLRYDAVEEGGYDNLYFEDADGNPMVMIYYKADGDSYYLLKDLLGTNVTVDLVYYNNDAIPSFVVMATDTDVTLNIDSAAYMAQTVANAVYIPTTITEDTTLDLPATYFGVSLTYVSSDTDYITDAGVVTTTDGIQMDVTITITATYNGTSVIRKVVVQVGDLEVSDVADAYDSTKFEEGDMIKVKGILTTNIKSSSYWLQDTTAGINLYVPSDLRDAFAELAFGIEIEVVGEIDVYNGLYEVKNFTYTVLNDTPALPDPADITDEDFSNDTLFAYQGQLVTVWGVQLQSVVTTHDDSFNLTFVSANDSSKTLTVRVESGTDGFDDLLTELMAYTTDDVLVIEGGILNWYYSYQVGLAYDTQIRKMTDLEMAQMAAAVYDETAEIEEGTSGTVDLTGDYGTTLTWDMSEVTAAGGTYDAVTGAYTMPDLTADATYTVTLTATKGTDSATTTITVTAYFVTEQMMLDADKDELELVLEANEGDVVTLPSTMSYGSVVTWVVTSGDATITGSDVTYNVTGAEQTVVLTATLTFTKADTTTITATKEFSVVVQPALAAGTYTETFENSTATSSYGDGTFTGVEGIEWTFVASRDDAGFQITDSGLMLRRESDSSSLTSGVITGGLSYFKIDMLKGFTGAGNRQIRVTITAGGVDHVYDSISWDNTDVQSLEITDLDITGPFTIKIENLTSKQVIIDNITWTTSPAPEE